MAVEGYVDEVVEGMQGDVCSYGAVGEAGFGVACGVG